MFSTFMVWRGLTIPAGVLLEHIQIKIVPIVLILEWDAHVLVSQITLRPRPRHKIIRRRTIRRHVQVLQHCHLRQHRHRHRLRQLRQHLLQHRHRRPTTRLIIQFIIRLIRLQEGQHHRINKAHSLILGLMALLLKPGHGFQAQLVQCMATKTDN